MTKTFEVSVFHDISDWSSNLNIEVNFTRFSIDYILNLVYNFQEEIETRFTDTYNYHTNFNIYQTISKP